jgi:hypothetical protein
MDPLDEKQPWIVRALKMGVVAGCSTPCGADESSARIGSAATRAAARVVKVLIVNVLALSQA